MRRMFTCRCRKEAVASAAPTGGSAGQRQSQGAQSQNAKAHSGGRDFGKSAAGSANDRAVCTGGLSDTEAAAARLNPLGDLRETGGLPLFSPEGRTYSPPAKAGGGSPPVGRARALSEGDCGSCGSRWTRLHFCQTASLAHAVGAGVSTLEAPVHGVVYCHPIPPPACVNLPPAA